MFQVIPVVASLLLTNVISGSVDSRLQKGEFVSRFVGYAQNAPRDKYVPNPKFWAKDVDLSCASPWNSDRGRLKAGTLVSKRHIVFAKHFPIANGSRIVFVDNEGHHCPCRMIASAEVPNSDIKVGLLDYEVTPNIHPVKILPIDYEKYIGNGEGLPVVTLTQNEKACVTDLVAIQTNATSKAFFSRVPTDPTRARFREKIIVGDSGNPAFLIVGSEPILIGCLKMGGTGAGPAIHKFRFEVQCVMDELCPGYKLESFDFSKVVEAKQ